MKELSKDEKNKILESLKPVYDELIEVVGNMTYEDAFKKLDGQNLEASETCTVSFDVEYKGVLTSVFKNNNGIVEVWEEYGTRLEDGTEIWMEI